MTFTKEDLRRAMLLYAVTDRAWLGARTLAAVTEALLQNGVTFLQLREKALTGPALLAQAEALRDLAARHRVPFVVNDDPDVALAVGADGVHVGQSDLHGRDLRTLLGPDKILGISANTVETAKAAQAAGADYIGVGAVFGTSTKGDAKRLTVAQLREIRASVSLPIVAIGGIGAENILQLTGSGADGVAVVSALYAQPDPGAAARTLRTLAERMVSGHG